MNRYNMIKNNNIIFQALSTYLMQVLKEKSIYSIDGSNFPIVRIRSSLSKKKHFVQVLVYQNPPVQMQHNNHSYLFMS
jgi:hypothetical protein